MDFCLFVCPNVTNLNLDRCPGLCNGNAMYERTSSSQLMIDQNESKYPRKIEPLTTTGIGNHMIIYINDLANWLNKHFKDSKNQQTSWKITRQTHSGVEVNKTRRSPSF